MSMCLLKSCRPRALRYRVFFSGVEKSSWLWKVCILLGILSRVELSTAWHGVILRRTNTLLHSVQNRKPDGERVREHSDRMKGEGRASRTSKSRLHASSLPNTARSTSALICKNERRFESRSGALPGTTGSGQHRLSYPQCTCHQLQGSQHVAVRHVSTSASSAPPYLCHLRLTSK